MVIMPHVIYEISVVRKFKPIFEPSIKNSHIHLVDMNPLGNDGQEFVRLRHVGKIGPGEAAAMAYARYHDGTIGSNNIRDILSYCRQYNRGLLTIRPIMVEAIQKGILKMPEAEDIWNIFKIKSRAKLPCDTVEQALKFYTNGEGAKYTLHKL